MHAKILHGATDLGSTHFCADLLWGTQFRVSDPVTLVEIEGKRHLLVSSLEVERAQKQARVDEVVHLESFVSTARDMGVSPLIAFMKSKGVDTVEIPGDIQFHIGQNLAKHFSVSVCQDAMYPARVCKQPHEIAEIAAAQAAVDRALERVCTVLSEAHIDEDRIVHPSYGLNGLTSEAIRDIIESSLYQEGFLTTDTIVACGVQAADPHMRGTGFLTARQPIVLDIFPRSRTSLYFTDCTRTVFKGEPSKEMKSMYQAVYEAQAGAVEKIRVDADGHTIYEWVKKFFEEKQYPTNLSSRPVYGFIHGLGHGVGLEIHEEPRLGACHAILQEDMVVTVEPGLYYSQPIGSIPSGGVRIEDTVVVKKDSAQVLSRFPKRLEDVIL